MHHFKTYHFRINPVLICIGIITGVCLSVVLFTFQDRYPYTPIISVFFVWTLLLVAFGGLFLSYGEDIVATFQLMIAPTLVSTYFAMTTQILVKDKEKAIMSNEYVYGAVQVSMYLVAVFAKIMYRIYSCCCPCCSCDNCGDICNELWFSNMWGWFHYFGLSLDLFLVVNSNALVKSSFTFAYLHT